MSLKLFRRVITVVILNIFMIRVVFADTYNIGQSSDEGFGLITNFFQKYIDFMTGPYAHMAIAAALIIAVIAWAIAPKEGLMGTVLRVVIAAFVVMNVATWMGLFGN